MKVHPFISSFAISSLLLVPGCVAPGWHKAPGPIPLAPTGAPAKPAAATEPRVSHMYWKGEGVGGPAKIRVNLDEQRAYFYKGESLVGETPVSSGRKGFETPPGSYHVVQKDEKHVSNLYGDYVDEAGGMVKKNVDTSKQATPEGVSFKGASMPYFLRFEGGYGLHAGSLPGHAASHGCVRLPRQMARRFFENVQVGTPVTVQ